MPLDLLDKLVALARDIPLETASPAGSPCALPPSGRFTLFGFRREENSTPAWIGAESERGCGASMTSKALALDRPETRRAMLAKNAELIESRGPGAQRQAGGSLVAT